MAEGALALTIVNSTSGASLLAVLSHPDIVWHHVCTMVGAGTGQLGIPWYRLGLPKAHSGTHWPEWFTVVHRVVVVHSGAQWCREWYRVVGVMRTNMLSLYRHCLLLAPSTQHTLHCGHCAFVVFHNWESFQRINAEVHLACIGNWAVCRGF